MAVYGAARSRAENAGDDAIKRRIDLVGRVLKAGSPYGSFVIEKKPPDTATMEAAMRWVAGVRQRQAEYQRRMEAQRPAWPQGPSSGSREVPHSVWESLKAGGRGALDSLPFGLGDYLPAAGAAVGAGRVAGDPVAAFNHQLALERGQNRYDEAVHPTARTVGKVTGTVAQVVAPGLGWAQLAKAPRMAQATPMIFREGSRLAGLGAGAGIAMQGADDMLRRRLSSPADYIGSGVGGAAGALAAIYGRPGYIGGVTGGVTSMAQDLFNGRVQSWSEARAAGDRASEAAATGNLFGLPVAGSLAYTTNKLSPIAKGRLGEWLGKQRNMLRDEEIIGEQVKVPVKGGDTIVDYLKADRGAVEDKFGYSHGRKKLRGRQGQAYHELPSYRVDHFTPNDLGAAVEVPMGALGYQFYDDDDRR